MEASSESSFNPAASANETAAQNTEDGSSTAESVKTLQERIARLEQNIACRYRAIEKAACESVKNHPGKAVALVSLAGLALGVLLGGKRRS